MLFADIDSLDIIAQTYFNLHRSGILSKSEWKQSSAYDVGTLVQLQRMHELQRTTEYLKGKSALSLSCDCS